MKKIFVFSIIIFSIVIIGCSDDNASQPEEKLESKLLGIWSDGTTVESFYVYKKQKKAPQNDYYIQLLPNNKLIEHKNSGWCGTPPISYATYNGKWTLKDSLIDIEVPYWGGMMYIKWKIVQVDNQALKIEWIDSKNKSKKQ